MKKSLRNRIFTLLLAMIMVFAVPMEAAAATRKVTAKTDAEVNNYTNAPAIKKGKNVVTHKTIESDAHSVVKFTAAATKKYTFTIRNIRKIGTTSKKSNINGIVYFFSGMKKLSEGGYTLTYTKYTEAGKKKSGAIYMQSAGFKNAAANQFKKTVTVTISMKKGQTVYLDACLSGTKIKYDVIIK